VWGNERSNRGVARQRAFVAKWKQQVAARKKCACGGVWVGGGAARGKRVCLPGTRCAQPRVGVLPPRSQAAEGGIQTRRQQEILQSRRVECRHSEPANKPNRGRQERRRNPARKGGSGCLEAIVGVLTKPAEPLCPDAQPHCEKNQMRVGSSD